MHKLQELIDMTEVTHKGLGRAIAFTVIAIKARQCLILVAPSGCGKSVITDTIAEAHRNSFKLLSVTRARLQSYTEEFSNFFGVVLMDDMAGAGGMYERKDTISAFCQLCYSHTISKHTMQSDFEIVNFHGAAVMNIQPALLAEVYAYPEWEGLIQEKTLRYYHLFRPTNPVQTKLEVEVDWGLEIEDIHKPRHDYRLYQSLFDIASIQWSDSRTIEHLDSLLKAVAALDKRKDVNNSDLQFLLRLMRPMTVERHVFNKSGFETGRYMDTNLCAVLVEYASWKNVNISRIARDYKVSHSTVYRLLSQIQEWFQADAVKAKMLIPKPALKDVLKEAGVER